MATCEQCGKIYNDADGVDNPYKEFCSKECEKEFYRRILNIKQEHADPPKKQEQVEHPPRYNRNGIEVWDIEKAFQRTGDTNVAFVEHLRFGAIEYILRCWDKNGAEDIRKAVFLLNRMLTEMEGGAK